jgi:hypothetical protein
MSLLLKITSLLIISAPGMVVANTCSTADFKNFNFDDFTVVTRDGLGEEEFVDNWIYDFQERPKRFFKDQDGRGWMIHGGVPHRQHVAAYLAGALYGHFIDPAAAPEYVLLKDPKGRVALGSPFISGFETLATHFPKAKGNNGLLQQKIVQLFKKHPSARLEEVVALGIWMGESDLHAWNLGIVEKEEGEVIATRVGSQHGFVGLNEQACREDHCDFQSLYDYVLNAQSAPYLASVIDRERLAQAFESFSTMPQAELREILEHRVDHLRDAGLIVSKGSGMATEQFIDNTSTHAVLADVDSKYRVHNVQKSYYPSRHNTEAIFEASWAEDPVWRMSEEEANTVIEELLARHSRFEAFAKFLRLP